MKKAMKLQRTVPLDEHVRITADLQETIAGYRDARADLQKALEELRQRNAAFAAEVQKLQHARDTAKRSSAERESVEQSLREQVAKWQEEWRDAINESSVLRSDLTRTRLALVEMAQMLAEVRIDARRFPARAGAEHSEGSLE